VSKAPSGQIREIALLFLRLGLVAFGGPPAHIAMMRQEIVRRKGWVDDERFVDLVGATNLIPGPNSTELAIHLGFERGRWRGLVTAGVCFILPAAIIVTALAWAYVTYGQTPAFTAVLYGVIPVTIAIIVHALFGLRRAVFKRPSLVVIALASFAAYLASVNELVILAAGAFGALFFSWVKKVGENARNENRFNGIGLCFLATGSPLFTDPTASQLWQLFITMAKIGAVLYGSGYVLLAFLEADFVDRLGWITEQQLLDAISIGQVTPGPVFTTATFVGYLVAGLPGAFVATVAIFAPSFLFVALLTKVATFLRSREWTAVILDGLNAASIALMTAVTWRLGLISLIDPLTIVIALIALAILTLARVNSAWLILAGALAGSLHALV